MLSTMSDAARFSSESFVLMKEVLSTMFSTTDLLISTSNLIARSHLPIFSRIFLILSKQKKAGNSEGRILDLSFNNKNISKSLYTYPNLESKSNPNPIIHI